MRKLRLNPLVLFLLASFIVGIVFVAVIGGDQLTLAQPETAKLDEEDIDGGGSRAMALAMPGMNPYLIADVAEKVSPAVVFISVEWPPVEQSHNPFAQDPFFREFFGDFFFPFPIPPSDTIPRAVGTGFIIDEKGYILTNQHVVGDKGEKQKIKVRITTENFTGEVDAKLLGSDYKLDLAVLKIEKPKELKKLPVAKLGDSDKSRPGEWVVAIGNPYGEQFEHTVTVGVLSAKGRQISIPDREKRRYRVYENLMQTDAAINPGNSGGPLINIEGEVIGINTAVNAAAQGIGFAIPINTAKEVVDELIHEGRVVRKEKPQPWVGVYFNDISEDIAQYFNLPDTNGVILVEIIPNSPAEKAGLQAYDIVRKVGNTTIKNGEDFKKAISQLKPGEKTIFVVIRRGNSQLIPVEIGQRPEGF